jgi:hypothetical protein
LRATADYAAGRHRECRHRCGSTPSYRDQVCSRRPATRRSLQSAGEPRTADTSRKVTTVKTNSTGSYTRKFTANRSGKWTVKYAGNSLNQRDSAADAVCVYPAGRWQCPVSPNNPDLDCPQIGKTVWVGTRDYHRLDADNDGWGCDSYS